MKHLQYLLLILQSSTYLVWEYNDSDTLPSTNTSDIYRNMSQYHPITSMETSIEKVDPEEYHLKEEEGKDAFLRIGLDSRRSWIWSRLITRLLLRIPLGLWLGIAKTTCQSPSSVVESTGHLLHHYQFLPIYLLIIGPSCQITHLNDWVQAIDKAPPVEYP